MVDSARMDSRRRADLRIPRFPPDLGMALYLVRGDEREWATDRARGPNSRFVPNPAACAPGRFFPPCCPGPMIPTNIKTDGRLRTLPCKHFCYSDLLCRRY